MIVVSSNKITGTAENARFAQGLNAALLQNEPRSSSSAKHSQAGFVAVTMSAVPFSPGRRSRQVWSSVNQHN